MITAIDTNVLLDVFLPDPEYGRGSLNAVESCLADGALVICEIVYAELSCAFRKEKLLGGVLENAQISPQASEKRALWKAGELWKGYRESVEGKRDSIRRMVPDFLIGAHALLQADRLLTRDRGFYRRYFRNLKVMAP
jgi:predicted nucleic acid-binding protein